MSVVHGGNVYEIAAQLKCSPDAVLDYSASINPLGPPAGLVEEFNQYFHRLQHYPDIHNRSLRNALADFHGLDPAHIVVGNGSTELIYWLPKVMGIRKALIVLPTFGEYQKAFVLQDVQLAKLVTTAEHDFQPTPDRLEALVAEVQPEAVLLTNPGSPSGALLSPQVRDWVVEKSRQSNMLCLVDEVFVDFCEDASLKRHLAEDTAGLVLIRSMTKFYGVPGLRLGYLLTSAALAERMERFLPPWSVNTLAQIAGTYCLRQSSYQRETLDLVGREREKMASRLNALPGCRVFPGEANYLLVELTADLPPASVLQEHLLGERILIRDCSSFEGLGDHHVRFAVRQAEANERLLEAVAAWLESHTK
jgi:threonine-phosphate decarboxylase